MALVFAAICPHPPLIIPTIGRPANLKLVSKTTEGMKKLAGKFAEAKPETIIVISPHGQIDTNNFTISKSQTLTGNFRHFGDPETKLVFENDQNLIEEIKKECGKTGIPLKLIEDKAYSSWLASVRNALISGENLPKKPNKPKSQKTWENIYQ